MTTSYRDDLAQTFAFLALAPLAFAFALWWLAWKGCTGLWAFRKPITLCALVCAFLALCIASPMLPLGLAITAAVGWVTYPRCKAVAA